MRASRCARPRRAVAQTFRESRYRNDRFVQRLFFSEFTKPRLCGCRRSPQLITDPHPWHAPASGVGQLVITMASRRARNGATAVVATTACFGMLAYYLRENPARGDADHLVGQAKTDSEVTTPSEIRRVTRDELHAAGFFTSFGFVAASVVVLELASGEAFGVNIRKLFELESPLEGNGIADVAAQIKHRSGIRHPPSEFLNPRAGIDHFLDLIRKIVQILRCLRRQLSRYDPPVPPKIKP